MNASFEHRSQRPRMSVDTLSKKIDLLRARLEELEKRRIKVSLKIVITNNSIKELTEKREKIDEKVFESLMTDYRVELRQHEKEEETLITKINSLEEQLELFEEYEPLLHEYEEMEEKMEEKIKKIIEIEKKLSYT